MTDRNIKLTIEYDGTNYAGWQRQTNAPSIEAELEAAIGRIVQERISLTGAGRTDAGVHALGQVANFHTASRLPLTNILRGANSLLPRDIAIVAIEEVPDKFNARRSALLRWYRYCILNRPAPSPIAATFCWHVPQQLKAQSMLGIADMLHGTHDFKGFRSQVCTAKRTVLTMETSTITFDEPHITIDLKCRSFLHNMVRIIVGLMVEAGKGKIQPRVCREMLDNGIRDPKIPTAPPQGLTLMKVSYK